MDKYVYCTIECLKPDCALEKLSGATLRNVMQGAATKFFTKQDKLELQVTSKYKPVPVAKSDAESPLVHSELGSRPSRGVNFLSAVWVSIPRSTSFPRNNNNVTIEDCC